MKKKNEEVQSRRDFFKKAAKAALPILGIAALASNPIVAKAAESLKESSCYCGYGCAYACSGTCKGGCDGSCFQYCQGSCKGTCAYGCKGTCNTTCQGSCSGSCAGYVY